MPEAEGPPAASSPPPPGAETARPPGLRRRLGWSVADQGISSLSNFVLGVVVARSLEPGALGAFTLAYVTFGFVLSVSRGTSTDPLLVRHSGAEAPVWKRAVAAAGGTALVNGVLAGALCVVLGLLLPGQVGTGFLALGVGLPGILVQDSYRFAFFSVGRGFSAFVNDLVWGVLQVAALAALLAAHRLTVSTSLLGFGATATLAAVLGCLQSGVAPRPLLARRWVVEHRALGGRYLVENLSGGVAHLLRTSLVGLVAGLGAVGVIRAAEILAGPFVVVLSGVGQIAVPEARQVLTRTPGRFERFCFWLASAQAAAAVLWAVFAFVVLPLGPGRFLLGASWDGARQLLLPVMLTLVLSCFVLAASAGVRALGASRRSLPAQLTSDGLYLVGGGLGAVLAGASGSSWGVAVSAVLRIGVWWRQLRKATAEHQAADP